MEKAIIFGAGKSGIGAKKILEAREVEVILVDDKVGIRSEEALNMLDEITLFIKSPGIPYTALIKKAIELGIEVIDEIELSYRELKKSGKKSKIIAITGTNGKTTTTAKTAEMLNFAGYSAVACGNIGIPFSEIVMENREYDYIVVELSSYQLENLKEFKADIAAIVNLTPDHLERYNSVDEYYDTKFNIGMNQKFSEKFILNLEDKESLKRVDRVTGHIHGVTVTENREGYVYVRDGKIICKEQEIIEVKNLALKGKHNLENMLFVTAVGSYIGVDREKLESYLSSAKAIEHRLEDFFSYGKIRFINDSKSTNVDSAKFAVEAYPESILICGGYNKPLDYSKLGSLIKENRMDRVYLIGENRGIILEKLREHGYPDEKIYDVENIENCASILKQNLNKEIDKVVLFSPGTSSYDQFENFEDRGRKFKEIIRKYFGG